MTDSNSSKAPLHFDAPKDRPEDESKGYAVYDRSLGGYFGGVHADKAAATEEAKGGAHLVVVRV